MAAEQLSLEMTNRGAWADECQLKNILNTAFLSSMSCPQHSVVSTTWVQLLTEREFLFASFQFAVLSQQITLFCLNSYNFQQQYRNLKKNPTRTTSGAARLDLVWNAHLLCAWIPAALSSSIKSGNHKCKDLGSWTQPEKKFEQFFLLQPEPSYVFVTIKQELFTIRKQILFLLVRLFGHLIASGNPKGPQQ